MAQKRTHFKKAILAASTNPCKNILAKRLVMTVRYIASVNPSVLSMEATGIRRKEY